MAKPRTIPFSSACRVLRRSGVALALIGALGVSAMAQAPQGVYAPGQAAVTGFSGALRPAQILPGQDPGALTFIDPEGASLRVIDLRRMGGPPEAQLVGAPKSFSAPGKSVGQVFGVALDGATPANIYVAASSAYGIAIVAPGRDGRSERVSQGTAGVSFMPAQWGAGGGPGSLWKIDGATGSVSLFANIAAAGKANSGAALGGLAYDKTTKSLFVADRESGLIHRIGLNGADLGTYDHGSAGLPAVGLAPSPPGAGPVDIASPQFDSARPESWGYAPPERRVFGLATRDHRLYYAVADGLRIWSVGLDANGGFGSDARIEIAVPPAAGPTEISKITFDDQGRIYLAERPAPTGAQDFEALSVPSIGRVLRYAVIGVTEAKQPIWQMSPDEYSVGFPGDFRNDNGGVAIGYSYDIRGDLNPASCGGFLWTTGEQLRAAKDPKLADRIGQKDALAIDGLQGGAVWLIRRGDAPPLHSYFIDYADAPPDASARGHMGDIAIARACFEQAAVFSSGRPALAEGATSLAGGPAQGATPPAIPFRPPSKRTCENRVCAPGQKPCPANFVWILSKGACGSGCAPPDVLVNGKCCSKADLQQGGACSSGGPSSQTGKLHCGTTQTPIGPNNECCENDHIYTGPGGQQACCLGALTNGKCDPIPKQPDTPCATCCASGYTSLNGACCQVSQITNSGKCCPSGQKPHADGSCQQSWKIPTITQCCAAGYVPTHGGSCCAVAHLTSSGSCCASAVNPQNRSQCPKQMEKKSRSKQCARGKARDENGDCVSKERSVAPPPAIIPITPILPKTCAPNERRDRTGACVPRRQRQIREPDVTPSSAVPRPVIQRPIVCPPGWVPGPLGKRCWPPKNGAAAPPFLRGRAPAAPPFHGGGPRISCPRGFAPGPKGMRCLPIGRQ